MYFRLWSGNLNPQLTASQASESRCENGGVVSCLKRAEGDPAIILYYMS